MSTRIDGDLDRLGADDDTRLALLMLAAVGADARTIGRLAKAFARGDRIYVMNDYYSGPPTPGVHGLRTEEPL